MPKVQRKTAKQLRHDPLEKQLREDEVVEEKPGKKKKKKEAVGAEDEDDQGIKYIDEALTGKILKIAQEQQDEDVDFPEDEITFKKPLPRTRGGPAAVSFAGAGGDDESESVVSEQEDEEEYHRDADQAMQEMTAEEMRILNSLNPRGPEAAESRGETLADIINRKIMEKLGGAVMGGGEGGDEAGSYLGRRIESHLDPKAVQAYKSVAKIMKEYKSGKLPKIFKIIPALTNWEEILFITQPVEWSKQAMYQATRVFASNLKAGMAQRFYNLVLLPCVREDIEENKKLNYHLYMALKKALYKPAAFYKGIVLPLVESRTCTLREAVIVASVVRKVSIPILHSAAALLKLVEMEYSGAVTVFVKVLLDKKYALPLRVVDAVLQHFAQFKRAHTAMPVLWHQALLVFVQRYKNDLEDHQKEELKALLRFHEHPLITAEIKRELLATDFGGAMSRVVRMDEAAPRTTVSPFAAVAGPPPLTIARQHMFARPRAASGSGAEVESMAM